MIKYLSDKATTGRSKSLALLMQYCVVVISNTWIWHSKWNKPKQIQLTQATLEISNAKPF